jgi:SAM-dependent methyltransferase
MNLTEAFTKHPSDKLSSHSYVPLYEELFLPYQESAEAILELGIMNGASLRAWRDFFTYAHVYGIDNDPARLITENRITSIRCDTVERDHILEIRNALPDFDIIIDDASHVITEQIWAVAVFWPKLKPGGLFIVEDIRYPQYLELFGCFQNVTLHDRRKVKGQFDDMLAVMKKK